MNTKVSHGSVATSLRCSGVFSDHSIRKSLLSLLVKELWKSVNISQSYWARVECPAFLTHSVVFLVIL